MVDASATGNPERPMPEIDPQSEHLTTNSLVTKIVLMVFAGSFAAAMLVSWAAIKPTQEFIAESIEEQYPAAVQRAAESATAWLSAGREELARLTSPPWDESSESALQDLLAESRYFEGFAICDDRAGLSDGVGSVPICPPATENSEPKSEWIATSLANGVMVTAASVSISREGASPRSAIGVFDREQLGSLLAEYSPDRRGSMLLTLGTGGVLAGSGPDPLSQVEPPDPNEASRGVRESTDSPWRHTIHAAHPLGESGWFAAFEIPFGEAYASLLVLIRRVLLIDLIAILALCFVSYRITSAVLTPIESLSMGARRVAEGQFEFEIPDPGTRDELGVLINAFNRMLQRIRTSQEEIQESNENLRTHNVKLQQANELLEQLSITDGLTKLHNHRFFQDQLTREIRRAERASSPLSLLLVDIDDFKSLNDRFGHASGDELLHGLALIMNAAVRSSDLLARYGGEEFAVLAPGTDQDGAYQLAEKLRTAIAESSFILGETMRITRVTVSVGVAQFAGNRKEFFEQADRALYRAKAAGKNCVMVGEGDSIA
ncbi:MAG: sensor domain-containing diguanylate cyclase [Deltaproteobacteria bacterium]|jgi:diguanylate cyclase (GGDEF)-like protein|nr:sensor domain-containing diguanylate cyclase [Deltaproteobacteria bacterium]